MMKQMMKPMRRRTILRGLGASLALPFLESLAWANHGKVATSAPIRCGTLLFANGVNLDEWWAKGQGKEIELSKTLSPLNDFRGQFSYLRGLHVYNNTSGAHTPLFTNFLSGGTIKPGSTPDVAVSVDQVMARAVGKQTPLPSMVLGVEPAEHGIRGNSPGIYYATISWSSSTTPIPPEIYPRAAFDRLFDTGAMLRERSVLDVVLEQSKSVRGNLDYQDGQKLDEFMTSVREIEQRLDLATKEERLEGWQPSISAPDMKRPPKDTPQDVREHMKLMLDLIVLAWQMDKTRIATLLFNRDVSHMQFGFLEGVSNSTLHSISHHKRDPEKLTSYQRINQYHVEQLAYVMGKMSRIDEGNGTTLLDNSMILFGSNMLNGDIHDGRDLPLILAGGGGGKLKSGLNLDYSKRAEPEQRLCNLHLSLAQNMGVPMDSFGDSIGPLTEVLKV